MDTLRDARDIVFALIVAIVAGVLGMGAIIAVIAAPFVALGVGFAIAFKICAWAVGYPA